MNKKTRKTDRRTIYTKNVIKDALLKLMEKKQFDQITVAALCRQAEITRATFYIHYDNLTVVLNELLEDALQTTEHESSNLNSNMLKMLDFITSQRNLTTLEQYDTLLPICQRIANQPKYRVLFLDESLSAYIIKKIYVTERDKIVPLLINQCHLSRKEADKLYLFVIYGAYEVNKSMHWEKNKEWYQLQGSLIRFILGGLDALT
ncbi:MAG TPA: TetR/AcrR family transcriptional regulator [Candidatus Fimimorpha faecalis]|uniref:TetR/AcrR family transcriptional regulator n=1 Tax=Candidatus Fimimorpha faecalis TaxID=2840824 RepID=A0A9D1EH34_9FIRM|nr:TetR/AcrR family transcriptional regulator [Candidatus Fimimorpha faecalis]